MHALELKKGYISQMRRGAESNALNRRRFTTNLKIDQEGIHIM